MKKLLVIVLVIALAVAFVGCGPKDEAPVDDAAPADDSAPADDAEPADDTAAGDDTAEETITVAGIVFQDDQFMNTLTQGYMDAAADLGVECLTANTNNDQAKESELINTYVGQGVDGIAIAPLSADASVAVLRDAYERGVEVAITNINLTDAEFIAGGFTSDDYTNCKAVGDVAAPIIKERFGDKTVKIALVQFASLLPDISKARVDGYLAGLDEIGVKYEIVADQDAWMQDTAIETAGGILSANPDLDVIITVNDGGTIGSAQAVVNAGLSEQVMVFGHDGSDQISSMILDETSPLQCVIAQDPYNQGYRAMTALVNAIRGEDVSDSRGKTEFLPGIVLSKTDLDAVNEWRADQGL